jgi:hypothetical protein
LIGFDAGVVNLQVRVWDITKGTDFTEATDPSNWANYAGATGNYFGSSSVFLYEFVIHTPASSIFNMNNFVGFSLQFVPVPEPSAFGLFGLGGAWLVFLRRRK